MPIAGVEALADLFDVGDVVHAGFVVLVRAYDVEHHAVGALGVLAADNVERIGVHGDLGDVAGAAGKLFGAGEEIVFYRRAGALREGEVAAKKDG